MMFTIERRRGTIEPARLCIARSIEPKPDMERVGRGEAHKRIKPKNLVDILGGGRPEPASHGKPKEARKDAKMPQ